MRKKGHLIKWLRAKGWRSFLAYQVGKRFHKYNSLFRLFYRIGAAGEHMFFGGGKVRKNAYFFSGSKISLAPAGCVVKNPERKVLQGHNYKSLNLSPSKRPRSLSLRWGMTRRAMKESVMKGAARVEPRPFARWSIAV